MMEQYIEIKAANPDSLLFYRMGDFYELFFEDAEVACRALGIVLTKRGKHLGRDIPMCGVPVHRSDEYLHRLIALGHRVAVCEQLEDPAEAKKRGSKSVVRRDVVRLVTPGTLTEDTLLDARRNNYLLAIARARAVRRRGRPLRAGLDRYLHRRVPHRRMRPRRRSRPRSRGSSPSEIIVSDALYSDPELAPWLRTLDHVTPLTRDVFDGATAERRLADYFAVATTEAFGTLSRLELTAAAACVTYVERTQLGKRPPLSPPLRESAGATLSIDQATRANLELMRTLGGERRGSLLAAIDRTVTAGRLAAAGAAARRAADRSEARSTGGSMPSRCSSAMPHRATGDARAAQSRARPGARLVAAGGRPRRPARSRRASATASRRPASIAGRARAIDELPGRNLGSGGERCASPIRRSPPSLRRRWPTNCRFQARRRFRARTAIDAALDEARALRDESRKVVAQLQARYADETGVRALKIRHNNVLGYFVEVTAQHGDKLMTPPLNAQFIHRQTLAGQVRFTTTELGELEAKIASAADRALGLELEIFEQLAAARDRGERRDQGGGRSAGRARRRRIAGGARGRAGLCAARGRSSLAFRHQGRPPSRGRAGAGADRAFIANDCDLSPPAKGEGGPHLAADRPEHGGQVDLPAPERADRHSRADGRIRSGQERA